MKRLRTTIRSTKSGTRITTKFKSGNTTYTHTSGGTKQAEKHHFNSARKHHFHTNITEQTGGLIPSLPGSSSLGEDWVMDSVDIAGVPLACFDVSITIVRSATNGRVKI